MRFSILASGSTGNAIYIETEKSKILVDAGLSGKKIEQHLQKIGANAGQIDAIFVTHEHIDHVKGLGVLARKYEIPIYLNEPTFRHLPNSVGKIPESLIHLIDSGKDFVWKDFEIRTIPISHDAAQPIAYLFHHKKRALAIVTDLGYVSKQIIELVRGADTLIWESNHDVEMLRMGSYPWNIKRRILSDIGHLSNEDAGEALTEVLLGRGEQVYLAHLSKENNLKELAFLTVKEILNEAGLQVGSDAHLLETFDDRPTPLREVLETRKWAVV
jgi:phosphoribosyl 1,2-cyclic phosphodiesterase